MIIAPLPRNRNTAITESALEEESRVKRAVTGLPAAGSNHASYPETMTALGTESHTGA